MNEEPQEPYVMENKNANKRFNFPLTISQLPYIRTTSVAELELCPKSWAAKYLHGMGIEEATAFSTENIPDKPSFSHIGTAMHQIIEDHSTGVRKVHGHPALGFVKDEAERNNLYNYLYDEGRHKREGEQIVHVEFEFEFFVHEDVPMIKGHIDEIRTIDGIDNALLIVDHKSNRGIESVEEWSRKPQQMIYAMAVRELFGVDRIFWRIGQINQSFDIEWESPIEDDAVIKQRIIKAWIDLVEFFAHQDTNDLEMLPERVHKNCGYCPLKKQCKTYKETTDNFHESMMNVLPTELVTRYEKLTLVSKLVKKELDDVTEEMVKTIQSHDGKLMFDGTTYTLENKTSRSMEFADAYETMQHHMDNTPGFYEDIKSCMNEIFSVKVTGIDKFHAKFNNKLFAGLFKSKTSETTSIVKNTASKAKTKAKK